MATGQNGVTKRRLGRIPVTFAVQKKNIHLNADSVVKNINGNQKQTTEHRPTANTNGIESSFSSSFCTDLDVEMLDAMDRMEQDFKVKKVNTPKSRKCQLQVQTKVLTKSPEFRKQINNGFKAKDNTSVSTSLANAKKWTKTDERTNVFKDANLVPSNCKENGRTLPPKEHNVQSNIQDIASEIGSEFKSPGDDLAGNRQLRNRRSVHLKDVNIMWQTPKIASTPQTTPNSRSARQNQLFKSLFTVQSPMNISDITLSSPCPGDNGRLERKSTEPPPYPEDKRGSDKKGTQPSKENVSNTERLSSKKQCKKTIFKDITNSEKGGLIDHEKTARETGTVNDLKDTTKGKENPNLDRTPKTNGNINMERTGLKKKSNSHEKSSILNTSGDKLSLANWGLPETVLNQYHSKGITTMFEWQAECLCTGNTLNGGNLVYSAPTSAGKTMVAELLVLKRVMETKKKAIFILPFVSVAREKMYYLQQLYQDAGIRVSGFMGSYSPPGGLKSVDVAVCTIEKGNGLLNRLLEHKQLDQLGIIVVDELHLVGDSHRGYLLELMLTKICYVVRKELTNTENQSSKTDNSVQIVGMSATLPNLDLLATWLHAELYHTDYRPVPLTECVKFGTAIYDQALVKIRDIDLTLTFKDDADHVIPLCLETVKGGHAVLVFCPTKNWCEKLSEAIAKEFYMILKNARPQNGEESNLPLPLDGTSLMDAVEQLKRTPVGLDSTLGRTIPFGVAYHHAGLTFDERDIVEGSFRQGIIKVLIATSTLSSGVNLPARRVIIRTPTFHAGKMIDILTYKQMIGRAGRKGVDTEGESILICKPNEREKAVTLVSSSLPPVQSCLVSREGEELSSSLKRAILEIVVSGVATVPADIALYTSCTMLSAAISTDKNANKAMLEACIKFLQENEFVCLQKVTLPEGTEEERFCPTQLGSAVLASSLSPHEGLVVFAELQKARQCFVLENELHIIYLVTPIYCMDIGSNLDWYQYYCLWENLSVDMKRVAELVGVQESFITRAIRGRILTKTEAQMRSLAIHRRFYTSLILHDLVHEVPLTDVARKYNCNKGQLQSLQQSAATFAGMVTVFCARLGWHNLELILSQFQNRLTFGIQRELCDLVRLSLLNGQRARVLYNAGYHTITALANADMLDVELVLKNAAPFQSKKLQENETEHEAAQRQKSRCIWLTGRKGVTELEAAEAIISEAKSIIQEELGGLGIQWKNGQDSSINDSDQGQGQSKSHDHSSVLRTPLNASDSKNNSLQKRSQKNSSSKWSKSKGGRRLSINRTISPKLTDSNNSHEKNPNRSVVVPPQIISGDGDKTGHREFHTVNSSVKSKKKNEPDTYRQCQILPKVVAMETEQVKTHLVTVQADIHQPIEKNIVNYQMEVNTDLNSTKDLEHFSHTCISFSTGKQQPELKGDNNDQNMHKEITKDNIPNAAEVATEKSQFEGELYKENNLSHGNDLFAGLTQEFEISCQPLETKNNPTENVQIGNKLEHFSQIKKSSDQDFNKIQIDCDPISLRKNNTDNIDNLQDEFADSFCLDTQAAMEISHHENIAESHPREVGNKEFQSNETEKNKKLPAIATSSYSDTVQSQSENLQLNQDNNTGDNPGTSPNLYLANDMDLSPVAYILSSRVQSSVSNHIEKVITANYLSDEAKNRNENLLNESVDLVAASNFERCLYVNSEDIFNDTDRLQDNDSYQDLHIPYQSGQERIFENHERQASQYHHLHEDLAVAMEMGDTFSSTVLENINKATKQGHQTELSDSLTFSMVEKVLDDSSPQNKAQLQKKIEEDNNLQKAQKEQNKNVKNSKCKKVKSKLSPGTLAFLDSMQSFSVPEASEKSGKIDHMQDSKTSSNKTETQKSRNPPFQEPTASSNGTKIQTVRNSSSEQNHHVIEPNTSVEGDMLPPTPPLNNVSCLSPHLTMRRTPDKLKLTPKRVKIGNKSSRSCLLDDVRRTSKKAKINDTSTDLERIKLQISQLEPEVEKVLSDDEDYTERTFDFDPDNSGISGTQNSFTVIDVCADRRLFDTFRKEWQTKTKYSVSVACERKKTELPSGGGIGGKFLRGGNQGPAGRTSSPSVECGLPADGTDLVIVGLSVSWENRDSYYISFKDEDSTDCTDDSLAPPPLDVTITTDAKLAVIQSVMGKSVYKGKTKTVVAFDSKSCYTTLVRACGVIPAGKIQDPKIAYWLLDPGAKEKNLLGMVHNYLPMEGGILEGLGGGIGYGSLGLTPENLGSGRFRATTESVLSLHLMEYFIGTLKKEEILTTFQDVEMPSIITLARMELNGFGYSENECESQMNIMLARLSSLEEQAYHLAGHPFSLTATEDIAQVLFIELQLPPDGDPSKIGQLRGSKRSVGQKKGRARTTLSTSKEILEKLKSLHPLPGIILEWRRISSALTKVVFQLQKVKVHNERVDMYRIFCETQFHTATGRVSMTEPNLQNIPKDFEITLPDVIGESPTPERGPVTGKKGKLVQMKSASKHSARNDNTKNNQLFAVSMRHAFVPFKGGILVAADYSQLELRMIAHLSKDQKLIRILNEDGDVFKMITAQWKGISPEDVTPTERQQAKQVCYGMIYGIGAKALGQQLEVDENEAAVFIETFKSRYPSMRSYLRKTVEFCRVKGYVQTMNGRRRYLPSITSTQPYSRAHAERQAVNTTVQGSAADLVKTAMNCIDAKLMEVFPHSLYTHSHKFIEKRNGRTRSRSTSRRISGGYLVLQLHDELIYEVCQEDLVPVVQIIQHQMENAMKLSVRLPVKVKSGPSWGRLEELKL